jgi:hypothetical protein
MAPTSLSLFQPAVEHCKTALMVLATEACDWTLTALSLLHSYPSTQFLKYPLLQTPFTALMHHISLPQPRCSTVFAYIFWKD